VDDVPLVDCHVSTCRSRQALIQRKPVHTTSSG
jgi:hypothetical protein